MLRVKVSGTSALQFNTITYVALMDSFKRVASVVKSFKGPSHDVALNKNSSNSSQKPAEIPRNILAFRTITTLLRFIQQDKRLKLIDPQPLPQTPNDSDYYRQLELSILNALATVAITQHEIVAITSKRTDLSKLELIASTTQSEDLPLSRILDKRSWMDFLLTRNSDFSTQTTKVPIGYPVLSEASKPADFKGESDEELCQYLDQQHAQFGR